MDDLDLGATIKGFMPGQKVFGRYTLKKILGRGGMGVVWLARDEELEREVALKFLPEVIMGDRGALEELKRETRRNLGLTHPHIVRIHDFVQDARTAAISMEYVEGDTLANLWLEQPEQERLVLEEARRLETVRLENERLEQERNEAKAKAERERIAAEQEAERQRLATEREREREREVAMAAHPWRMIELYLREGRTLWEVPAIAEAGAVAAVLREYEQAKATLTRLPERYRSKHPRIIEAVAAVEDAGRAMRAAARDAADRQRLDYGLKFNQGQAPGWEGLALVGPENWLADFRQQLAQMDEVVSGVADQPKIPAVGSPWTMPDLVLRLMPVSAGTFLMGSALGGDNNERPLTRVTISRPYWLGQTEVTQAQWHMLMGSDPAGFPGNLRRWKR
jgi:hypothetical protein